MMGKKLLSMIIVLIAVSMMIYSCGSSDSNKISTSDVALHEHAFKDDPNLYAQLSHVTVLEFEHDQESNVHEKDSGIPGVDIIPYIVRQGGNHTFEFEYIGNGDHYAILRNENEIEVARMDPDENFVTVYLVAGKYKLYLHNMGTETFPLFLQPVTADVGSNRQASFNPIQLAKFLFTHSCAGCDLSYAFLPISFLSGANLSHANLSHANLYLSFLSGANLSHANLSHADLRCSGLEYADLTYANLTYANLVNVEDEGPLGCRTSMEYADLSYANLTGAKLPSFTDLYRAKCHNTVWIDGTTVWDYCDNLL